MCSECGAPADACRQRFDECLALEFQDSRYGRVHNLTVCTYMLQHSSRLSREGWLHERDLLREFLIENKPPDRVRNEMKDVVDSRKRTFKFKSKDGVPTIPHTEWARTILDVRVDDSEQYCQDVIGWASTTLQESERIQI